jgi:hypothetical protein
MQYILAVLLLVTFVCGRWLRKQKVGCSYIFPQSSAPSAPLLDDLGKEYCQPPVDLPNYKWFGRDRLEQIIRAADQGRLMPLYHDIFQLYGYTIAQHILGRHAFGTIEPINIKMMLTNTEGRSTIITVEIL